MPEPEPEENLESPRQEDDVDPPNSPEQNPTGTIGSRVLMDWFLRSTGPLGEAMNRDNGATGGLSLHRRAMAPPYSPDRNPFGAIGARERMDRILSPEPGADRGISGGTGGLALHQRAMAPPYTPERNPFGVFGARESLDSFRNSEPGADAWMSGGAGGTAGVGRQRRAMPSPSSPERNPSGTVGLGLNERMAQLLGSGGTGGTGGGNRQGWASNPFGAIGTRERLDHFQSSDLGADEWMSGGTGGTGGLGRRAGPSPNPPERNPFGAIGERERMDRFLRPEPETDEWMSGGRGPGGTGGLGHRPGWASPNTDQSNPFSVLRNIAARQRLDRSLRSEAEAGQGMRSGNIVTGGVGLIRTEPSSTVRIRQWSLLQTQAVANAVEARSVLRRKVDGTGSYLVLEPEDGDGNEEQTDGTEKKIINKDDENQEEEEEEELPPTFRWIHLEIK